jgi:hypothetical protein
MPVEGANLHKSHLTSGRANTRGNDVQVERETRGLNGARKHTDVEALCRTKRYIDPNPEEAITKLLEPDGFLVTLLPGAVDKSFERIHASTSYVDLRSAKERWKQVRSNSRLQVPL